MQIQVNSDDNVDGRESLARYVEGELTQNLARFASQVTRIEVHLGDMNADKTGSGDKRCMLEARLAGRNPEAVSHNAATLQQAINGAIKKLRRSLDSTLGRLGDHKGAASIRDGGALE